MFMHNRRVEPVGVNAGHAIQEKRIRIAGFSSCRLQGTSAFRSSRRLEHIRLLPLKDCQSPQTQPCGIQIEVVLYNKDRVGSSVQTNIIEPEFISTSQNIAQMKQVLICTFKTALWSST